MTHSRMSIKAKLAVAGTTVTAAALPFQVGVAHASTPDEDLSACISTAIANMSDTFASDVDACVNAYLAELGVDTSTMTTDATSTDVTSPDDSTVTAVNTAILGTATADDGTTATSADSGTS